MLPPIVLLFSRWWSMITVALRNLLSEKIRFGVTVLGVAFSVFLISLFLALFRGFTGTVDDYIESVPADVWVVQRGTRDLMGVSMLPDGLVQEIRDRGSSVIKNASGLLMRPTDIVIDGEPLRIHGVGYDIETGLGGPANVSGKSPPGPGEVVIDKVLSDVSGLGIGDSVGISEKTFRVVGISHGGNFVFTQLLFMRMEDAREVLGVEGVTNFVVIDLKNPSRADSVKKTIEENAPFAEVISRDQFIDNTREQLTSTLVPLLVVIVIVGLIVGTAVVGLTIYTLTVERMREYGIMKAVGFTNWDLFRVVIQQALIAGALGYGVGILFVLGASRLLGVVLPQFATTLTVTDLVGVAAATLAMSVTASYIPVRRLARLDPVIVFNP